MPPPESPNPPELHAPALVKGPFYSTAQLPDSPKPPNDQWRGVLISAPAQAVLSLRQPMVLLHGFYRVPGTNFTPEARLKITAIDAGTKRQYSALAGQREASPDEPPPRRPPPDPELMKTMIFSQHFNTDLIAALGLPWTNATYKVKAEFGSMPSNEISVQVVVQQ